MSCSISPGHHGHYGKPWQFVEAADPQAHALDAQVRKLLVPGQHQADDDQQRQAERGGDQGMAGSEAWRMVSLAHENGCNLDSCAGRKRR